MLGMTSSQSILDHIHFFICVEPDPIPLLDVDQLSDKSATERDTAAVG
jgi:hypothetical protein